MPGERRDILLDTHALLWWQASSDRVSTIAASSIASAAHVLVSPVSCWEVGMLVEKGRVRLDRPVAAWVRDVFALERVQVADLTPAAAVAAAELPNFHGDPADRFLYATARSRQAVLITKDERLRRYAQQEGDVVVAW